MKTQDPNKNAQHVLNWETDHVYNDDPALAKWAGSMDRWNTQDTQTKRTLLEVALDCGSLKIVKALLEAGVSPLRGDLETPPLSTLLATYPLRNYKEEDSESQTAHLKNEPKYEPKRMRALLNNLLKYGADVNEKDSSGETPLHVAASGISRINKEIQPLWAHTQEPGVKIRTKKINPNLKDSKGNTSCHTVLSTPHDAEEAILWLEWAGKAGYDWSIKNRKGETTMSLLFKTVRPWPPRLMLKVADTMATYGANFNDESLLTTFTGVDPKTKIKENILDVLAFMITPQKRAEWDKMALMAKTKDLKPTQKQTQKNIL